MRNYLTKRVITRNVNERIRRITLFNYYKNHSHTDTYRYERHRDIYTLTKIKRLSLRLKTKNIKKYIKTKFQNRTHVKTYTKIRENRTAEKG